jgi:hypothetical protein
MEGLRQEAYQQAAKLLKLIASPGQKDFLPFCIFIILAYPF